MEDRGFLKGAAVLGIAGAIVKVLGAFYRIPLGNILLDEGMGYYQTAYPFYVLLLTLATAGFPVAIAKLVSEKRALENYKGAHQVFKISFRVLFITGSLASIFVLLNAKRIVGILENPNAYYSLIGLVPALFFVPIMASLRGYFQGQQTMKPTALSQVTEQLFRVVGGLGLTYIFMQYGLAQGAGGASLGGSLGALAGTLAIGYIYIKDKDNREEELARCKGQEESVSKVIKSLLVIAIPITIGSAIVPIMNTIDTFIVLRRLQSIGYSQAQANALYGQLTGFAQTLINFPQVFSMALAMSLVPSISRASVKNNRDEVNSLAETGIRITLLIGLPAAFGLFILSEPIIGLLYYKNPQETIVSIAEILKLLSFGVIFLTLVQSLTAILQGLGKPFDPVKNLFVGAVVKTILTYILTGIPSINVKGAAISTVIAYLIAAVLDLYSVKKYTNIDYKQKSLFINPLISALGMMLTTKITYSILSSIMSSSKFATVISIGIAAVVYGILLLLTGSITYEDFKVFKKGEKIGKRLRDLNLLKD